MRSYALASSRDLSNVISVGTTYYLPQGSSWSSWTNSGQSDPARLPWGKGVTEQVVAVRWALRTPATDQIITGDTFTFSLPLTFTREATSTVLSPTGTWVGVATFAKNGTIKAVLNTSALSTDEMPLQAGYIPFIMTRPSSGHGGGSSSGGSGSSSSSTSNSSSNSSSSSAHQSSSSSSSSSGSAASTPSNETTPVATSVTPTDTAPSYDPTTTPPVTTTTATTQQPPASGSGGNILNLDVSQIGTVALAVLSAGIVFLALLIAWKRRRLPV